MVHPPLGGTRQVQEFNTPDPRARRLRRHRDSIWFPHSFAPIVQFVSALERSVLLRHHFRVAGVTGPHISPRHGPIRWHLPLSAHITGTPRFRFASASQESLRSTRERCSPQPGREQPEKSPGNPLRPPPWRNRRDFSRRSHCPRV